MNVNFNPQSHIQRASFGRLEPFQKENKKVTNEELMKKLDDIESKLYKDEFHERKNTETILNAMTMYAEQIATAFPSRGTGIYYMKIKDLKPSNPL